MLGIGKKGILRFGSFLRGVLSLLECIYSAITQLPKNVLVSLARQTYLQITIM